MITRNRAFCLTLTLLLFSGYFRPSVVTAESQADQDVAGFIEDMAINHAFDRQEIAALLNKAKVKNSILKAIQSPSEAIPWHLYREIFLTDRRIRKGVAFWQKNESILNEIADQYGVPPEIIVAIIGVETQYGDFTGSHRVLDALYTLAFKYPKRSRFFRAELKNFLLLCREENIDPTSPKGSYAGAMGLPQFMPSSFRNFAADSNNDNRRDIWTNHGDTIASVANYFAKHGWQRGMPVTFRVEVNGMLYKTALGKDLKPNHTIASLVNLGVQITEQISPDEFVRLLKFQEQDGDSFWIGMKNFYVISRYNHSAHYSMAVYQLSQAILAKQKTGNPA